MEIISLLGVVSILLAGGYFMFIYKKKDKSLSTVHYPLRLNAAERMILFLERIKPENLLTRLSWQNLSSLELQSLILQEIKNEWQHNLSQQLYLSDETWQKIMLASQTTSASLVHQIGQIPLNTPIKEVVVKLLSQEDAEINLRINDAIISVKNDIQKNF